MSKEATPSESARSVKAFLAMEILERAQELERQGIDIVHLELGEPDFDVPPCVRDAAQAAIRDGDTHYTHSLGILELREEIARTYLKRYGVTLSPEQVIVTTGSSGGLGLVMAFLLNPGDEVLLPDPGYPCYVNFVRTFHGEPKLFELDRDAAFRYDHGVVRSKMTPKTRAVMVNSPANPTAVIQERRTLEELAALEVPLVSDEIYHGLEYGPSAPSILEVAPHAFVLDGFSKRYAMTGWRIGWLISPPAHVATLQKLQQNLFICAGCVAQRAALAALRHGAADVSRMLEEYRERRSRLLEGLRRLGFGIPAEPQGAYYILADARHLAADSLALARRILDEAHVGVTPGVDFGPAAEGHLRFSFASSLERIEEGIRRLERWLQA